MKLYLLSALLFFSSLAFCQEKKEAPKSEEKSSSKKKGIPPTPLSTRSYFIRYSPKYIAFQDAKQNDIPYSAFSFSTFELGFQWFTKKGNIFNAEAGFATADLTGDGFTSPIFRSYLNTSYLFDIKKYSGWDFYLGPEIKPRYYSKTHLHLLNNSGYASIEIPVMLRLSAVKNINKKALRFDLGLSAFAFIAESNSFAGDLVKAQIETGTVDYRYYTDTQSNSTLFKNLGFATINKYFKVYTNITYQFNSMLQFNYLWNYSSFAALSDYPTRYGEHNIGVTFLFGRMKKTN